MRCTACGETIDPGTFQSVSSLGHEAENYHDECAPPWAFVPKLCLGYGGDPPRKTIEEKVEYVKSQRQTRDHHCHWPGCEKQVPPAMWGCKAHWMRLPKRLRDRIWATYVPGQERTMTPSDEYLEAADEVQEWIKNEEASKGARYRQAVSQVEAKRLCSICTLPLRFETVFGWICENRHQAPALSD